MSRRPSAYVPYTPETHPGLSQEACEILNTPLDQLDPATLRMLFAGLACHIAENVPRGSGLSDPQAVFSTLWGRLAGPLCQAEQDNPADRQPDETACVPAEAVAATPPAPGEPSEAQAPGSPDNVLTEPAAAAEAMRHTGIPSQPVPAKPAWPRGQPLHPGYPRVLRDGHRLLRRGLRHWQQNLPPAPRLYYACAGPP